MQTLETPGEKLSKELKVFLENAGYKQLKEVNGRGLCGIFGFLYTVAIVEGIDKYDYKGRWCYPHAYAKELVIAYNVWDDVDAPKGRWIKYKGDGEEKLNLNFENNEDS
jgi:hypothetical protein